MSAGAAAVTNTFPGLNFVRVAVSDMTADTAAKLEPYVDALTSQGVVVELEDHNCIVWGDGTPILTGSALSSAVQTYTNWAQTFKGNPNVVFGTENEPTGTGRQIDAEISAIYNAIRGTGNNNLILMDPYQGNNTSDLTPSTFSSMTNVAWDLHYYNGLANYSTSLIVNQAALANEVAAARGIESVNGVIPVIIGEYGPAGGSTTDPGGTQAVAAVEESGLGSVAWAWETGTYAGDLVNPPWTGGPSTLTSYGKTVAQFIATGDPGPYAGNANLYIAPGQTVDLTSALLAQAIQGLPSDLLSLTAVEASGASGTVTLRAGDLTYTAPASGSSDAFTYTVSNQLGESSTGSINVTLNVNLNTNATNSLAGSGNIVIGGNGSDTITGGTGKDQITLGDGNDTIATQGNNNKITLGNGTDSVSVVGNNNNITVGNGNDFVSVAETGNSVTVGSGQNFIATLAGGADTFTLNGGSSVLVLQGSNNKVVINGGSAAIGNFSATNDVLDLAAAVASSLHWTTAAQVNEAVTSDHAGGSVLGLGGYGAIDFVGVAPSMFHTSNFQIG